MEVTLRWLLVVDLLGIVASPLCLAICASLPGRGYPFAKTLGMLLVGYVFWLLNSLHALPNSRSGVFGALALVALLSIGYAWPHRRDVRAWLQASWKLIVAWEALFTIVFIVVLVLRVQHPEIVRDEKPMDFMLLNAATRANHFPPQDPWLSGHTVPYYYFGHLLMAMTGRLASVPTSVAYNLGIATAAALAFCGACACAYELLSGDDEDSEAVTGGADPKRTRSWIRALTAGAALLIVGNLVWALFFLSSYGIGDGRFYDWINSGGLTAHEPRATWYPSGAGAYFAVTRLIPLDSRLSDFTTGVPPARLITEFPAFTVLLGDLHAHLLSLPFVMLALGFALCVLRGESGADAGTWRRDPVRMAVLAVVIGGLGFINTWDLPMMLVIVALAVAALNRTRGAPLRVAVMRAVGFTAPLALLAIVFYAPFYLTAPGAIDGVLPVVTGRTTTEPATRPLHAFLFWGPLLGVAAAFAVTNLAENRRAVSARGFLGAILVGCAIPTLWVVSVGSAQWMPRNRTNSGEGVLVQIMDRGDGWITSLFLAALLVACVLTLASKAPTSRSVRASDTYALVMITAAVGLMLLGEFFFVAGADESRTLFVFKSYIQAWELLAVADGYVLWRLLDGHFARKSMAGLARNAGMAAGIPLLVGGLLYGVTAPFNRNAPYDAHGQRTESPTRGEIDGLSWLDPAVRDAVRWLDERAQGQSLVIAEQGRANDLYFYSFAELTGVPSVLGFPLHEDVWRGGPNARRGRAEDLEALYATTDMRVAQAIIARYGVTHLIVGPVERAIFTAASLAKFASFRVAFETDAVTIYDARETRALALR